MNNAYIAIYCRKSRFTGKGESIGSQAELGREYVRAHYGEAALADVRIYEDEGFSGGNLNRPGFREMMDAGRARRLRAVIVYRLDRISRSISDFAGLIEELSRLEIAFVSIKEQFDTGTPMGRAMMYIASVFSQLERETIAERIRDNLHELAKTGRWLGGITPTGYASEAVQSVSIDGKARKACRLKLLPEEAGTVRTIYDLFMETDSLAATEAELMRLGLKTKNNKYFTRFSIKGILKNPVYAMADGDTYAYFVQAGADLFSGREAFDGVHGMMAYNRTSQEKGKATRFLPEKEWVVSVGRHPGVVPGRSWVRVQESLERNKSRAYGKPRGNEALLTGLLYCSCGSRMYPKSSHSRTGGKAAYTYVCKMKERSRGTLCSGKNADGNSLDAAVLEQIKGLAEDQEAFGKLLEQSRRHCADGKAEEEERLAALRREQGALEQKIEGLVDSLADLHGGLARRQVGERIEELNEERLGLRSRMEALEERAAGRRLEEPELKLQIQFLALFSNGIDEMTVEQRRAAVRAIVRRAVWDGESAQVELYGASGRG